MRLYDYTKQEMELIELVEQGVDIGDTLSAVQEMSTEKIEGYAKLIRLFEGNATVIKLEEKRLQTLRNHYESGVGRLKENVYQHMQDTGKRKIDSQLFKIAIQKNPPSLEVLDESLIPKGYFITPEPVLDKAAIKEELKLGHEVEGVQLKQGESLRIK